MLLESLEFVKSIEGMEMNYCYGLIESNYMGKVAYGIYASKSVIKEGKIIDKYEDNVKYVSPIKEKVINLRNLLFDNQVSPIHLIDVAGEYIDNCVNDFDIIEKMAV